MSNKLINRLSEIKEEAKELRDELQELAETDELSEDQEARFNELIDDDGPISELEAERKKVEQRLKVLEAASKTASVDTSVYTRIDNGGDPLGEPDSINHDRKLWDFDAIQRAVRDGANTEIRSRALSAVEKVPGMAKDDHREAATRFVEMVDEDSDYGRTVYQHVLNTSSPEYFKAWRQWIDASLKNRSAPDAERILSRAQSLTDGEGGYAVPLPIDPTIVKNYDVGVNPFRGLARQTTITGDVLRTVNYTAVAASWDGEAAEVSDDASTLANIDITVHKAQAFVPHSIEIGQDHPNFTEVMGDLIRDGRDDLEATAFATGTGTNQPVGIVTALTGGSFEVSSNSTDTFALADVYDLEEELPAQARARASWVANKRIYQAMREAGGANLDDFWANLGQGQPSQLLGYPAFESSAMDGTITALSDNYVLILGDFSNYWIVDRAGLAIEVIPHLFATGNNRPSGQRGLYAWWRVGADSVNDRRFRMLNVT